MKVSKLTPNFSVSDIKQTIQFYQDILGFKLIMAVPETQDRIEEQLSEQNTYVYALVVKDNVELMFQRTDTFKNDIALANDHKTLGASVSFYMEVEGIEKFYNEIQKQNIKTTELKTAWYGMREFYLKDNNGYILGFAEKAAAK
jgi:uncharacterized glyoxalase superfamily protein PhnB